MPILRTGPSMDRWQARFHLRWQAPAFGAMAVTAGLAAIAPLASLIVLALGETGDLWTHLARYVIPAALARTALLLAGVAVVTIIIRRRNSPFRFRPLSIRLSRRARDVSDSGPAIHRAGAHARRATMGTRAAHHFAAGAARNKRWRVACLARDTQRHRRERISRRAHPDAVHLHHLAQSRA